MADDAAVDQSFHTALWQGRTWDVFQKTFQLLWLVRGHRCCCVDRQTIGLCQKVGRFGHAVRDVSDPRFEVLLGRRWVRLEEGLQARWM
ncbi:MAG: hypothetical protein ACI9OJ_005693 [Myxococcota bacterium]|jgi:hypothetical protein